jgi:endoglucanase
MGALFTLIALLTAGGAATAADTAAQLLPFRGVSLAGAEFGESEFPGAYDTNYTYPKASSAAYFSAKGMNLVRLPFRWERLQPELKRSFDARELARIKAFVSSVTATGMYVLLDPHNYARYRGNIVGSAAVPNAAFANFWSRLAKEFKNNRKVLFGLMNEPNTMSTEVWVDAANAAIHAIRATGATNTITVPGNAWTGAHSWLQNWYGTPNAEAMLKVEDSGNNSLIEVHQYFDPDNSGTTTSCVEPKIAVERLSEFTSWARQHDKLVLLGELGVGDSPACRKTVTAALDYLHANADVWIGWSWWAAGPWWGDYFMSIEPDTGGRDKPLISVLKPYLGVNPSANLKTAVKAKENSEK